MKLRKVLKMIVENVVKFEVGQTITWSDCDGRHVGVINKIEESGAVEKSMSFYGTRLVVRGTYWRKYKIAQSISVENKTIEIV